MRSLVLFLALVGCATVPVGTGTNKHGITVVEYGASWCPACVRLKPKLELKSKQFGFNITEIDTDKISTKDLNLFMPFIPMISIYRNCELFYHGPYLEDKEMDELFDMAGVSR